MVVNLVVCIIYRSTSADEHLWSYDTVFLYFAGPAFCMTVTGEGWGWGGEEPTLRQRENLALQKSFNTLWRAQNS